MPPSITITPAPFNLQNFFNKLTDAQKTLTPIDFLRDFQDKYKKGKGDSLIKFLLDNCADRSLDKFIDIALILKDMINKIDGIGMSAKVLEMVESEKPLRDGPEGYPNLLAQAIATNQLEELQQHMEAFCLGPVPRMKTPELEFIWPHHLIFWRDFFSFAFHVISAKTLYVEAHHNDNYLSLLLSFSLASIGNFIFVSPPTVLIQALTSPFAYSPSLTDSPGMSEYKRVLRTVHKMLYLNGAEQDFGGSIANWVKNRPIQWRQNYHRASHFLIGSTLLFPLAAAPIGVSYDLIKDRILIHRQATDPAGKITIPARASDDFSDAMINGFIYFAGHIAAYNSSALQKMLDENTDPDCNAHVKAYMHFYVSSVLGLALVITCREGPKIIPAAAKMLWQAPTVIHNTVTSARQSASNAVARVVHYWWPRQHNNAAENIVASPSAENSSHVKCN